MKIKFLQSAFAVLSLGAFFVAASTRAQDEQPIRVETDLVTVNVAVTDKPGNFIKGLRLEQFEIFDDGERQTIAHFSDEHSAASFGIVYDLHPTTDERTTTILEALRQFTRELNADDEFFITAFNERGSLNLDFVPTVEQIENNLSATANRSEPSALYDAVYAAAGRLRESKLQKRTLLIISDSADHNSRHPFKQLLDRLESFDVQVYAVFLDDRAFRYWTLAEMTRDARRRSVIAKTPTPLDRASLDELSRMSGGSSYTPNLQSRQELYGIFRRIALEMRSLYTLGFYPSEADSKRHRIKVLVNQPKKKDERFVLSYRRHYQNSSKRSKT
jgi:Ca-activated chloride channel homolog